MRQSKVVWFKDYGAFKVYIAENGKHSYFVVLSKYGVTVIKEKLNKKQ